MIRLALALLSLPALAHAGTPSALWDDVVHPNRIRCISLVSDARHTLEARTHVARLQAYPLLLEAIRLCPTSLPAYIMLGRERTLDDDLVGGRAVLEKARALSPDGDDGDPQLSFQLGFARSSTGDLQGGLVEYRRAEAQGGLGSDEWLLQYDLGDTLVALGRLGEAIEAYRKATRLSSEVLPRYALAVALERDDQLERSSRELTAAMARDPQLQQLRSPRFSFLPAEEVHYYLYLVFDSRGQRVEARAELENFLHALPGSPYAGRARAHLRRLSDQTQPRPPVR